MARKSGWKEISFENGVYTVELLSWNYFSDYISQELLNYSTYVYRGHADYKWKLEPTIDRILKNSEDKLRQVHLENFKLSTRGRRGPNPANLNSENDWWALGQHHGLKTPLLDWTESPFVALFFAAINGVKEKSKYITVFCLSQHSVEKYNKLYARNGEKKLSCEIFRPMSDENSRLVSQRGLFSKTPNNIDLESWIKKYYTPEPEHEVTYELIKINIPRRELESCLKYLNRMNINPSTLFPDLYGSSKHCNLELDISGY